MRGWARRATNFTYYEKGYKQVMKKISNESKGCRDVCLNLLLANNVLKQGGNTEW